MWEGDERARVEPVVAGLARAGVAVSIDTRRAAVMTAALAAGATLVNDVSALLGDPGSAAVVAAAACPVVVMHSPDPTGGLHGDGRRYDDVLVEVHGWLEARVAALEAAGVPRARVIVDPGVGFGKGVADNLALLNGLALFQDLGCPVLVGASRKRFIGALSAEEGPRDRLAGSIAAALKAADGGAQLLRVHDVAETVQALKVRRGWRDRGLA